MSGYFTNPIWVERNPMETTILADIPSNHLVPLSGTALAAAKLSLTALPSGAIVSVRGRRGRKKKGSKSRDSDVGKAISKFYNMVAGRPKKLVASLEQSITVILETPVSITPLPITFVGRAFSFVISTFSSATAYLATFDQYMIREIEVWLESSAVLTNEISGTLITAIDLDDAVIPPAASNVGSKQGSITSSANTGHYHRWQPHVAVAVYSGAFTSFGNTPMQWCDSASPLIQHYGLKLAYTADVGATPHNLRLSVRAKVSFRAPGLG